MKIRISTDQPQNVAAQAMIVIHEKTGLLAESDHPVLKKHFETFVRDVDKGVCHREWFCTIEKSAGVATHHVLLESATFGDYAPLDEPLKITAARAVALCREYSLMKLAICVQHKLAAHKAAAIIEGIILGDFRDDRFKGTTKKDRPELQITLIVAKEYAAEVKAAVTRAQIVAEAQNFSRELVNTPHHLLTPEGLAAEARKLARTSGMTCRVLNEKQLRAQGHEPICEVGRGSEYPPRLIILSYTPKNKTGKDHIALVGKGITFDTGGLSIKTADTMRKMNYDMAGAAAVLGAIRAIAALGLPQRVTAIIPAAHNAVDGAAYHPGSIMKAKNGKTIFIENTDAEGRLVLTDGLFRAGQEKATIIVDVATLTGAIKMALGGSTAGLFTEDEDLRRILIDAGEKTGDDVWPFPLTQEYDRDLKHPLADLRNAVMGGGGGGAITAALFLKHFVPPKTRWAHLDIAGTAACDGSFRYYRSGATGYGVRLLTEMVRLWTERGQ